MRKKKALVIGLGISGRSAAAFLLKQEYDVHAVDSKSDLIETNKEAQHLLEQGMAFTHDQEPLDLSQFDTVIVSPGIPQKHPLYMQAKSKGMKILGEVELACQAMQGVFLGITGTNGKTTTTLLVTHVLNQNGYPAKALGNVGVPLTSQSIGNAHAKEIHVVELSSYQLETMHSHVIDAGVLLNITPDHLDRHGTMENYALAKFHMGNCLKTKGTLYVEHKTVKEFGHLVPGLKAKTYGYIPECDIFTDLQHLYSGKKIECILPLAFQGKRSHDLENIMAAYALCQHVGVTPDQFIDALATFKKPSHRIEFVRNVRGVAYYDDSKGTNIDAVIRAVEVVPGKIILIAGGVDKGASYLPWISSFGGKVRLIYAIGQAAEKIQTELGSELPVVLCKDLEDAVNQASKMAQAGESVLLSPGCSSFDMFRDYVHRGDEFQRLVRKL